MMIKQCIYFENLKDIIKYIEEMIEDLSINIYNIKVDIKNIQNALKEFKINK